MAYCEPGRSRLDNVLLILDFFGGLQLIGHRYWSHAFDWVEHGFFWKFMERFGFSHGFSAMIKVLFSDIESLLLLYASCRLHRGVLQGCAL